MRRMLKMIVASAIVVAALALSALPGIAGPPSCDENPNGCKSTTSTTTTTVDDPNKNNPKFFSVDEVVTEGETRGNFNKGQEDKTLKEEETDREQIDCQNPSGKPNGPTCN